MVINDEVLASSAQSSRQAVVSDQQRADYVQEVEVGMGSEYMSTVNDLPGFEAGVQDVGNGACSYALGGKSRDEYQQMFREQTSTTENGSGVANNSLNSVSLIMWSSALKHLCPEAIENQSTL